MAHTESTSSRLRIGRRALLGSGAGLAAGLALSACSGSSNKGIGSGDAPKRLNTPTYVAPKTVEGGMTSSVKGVPTAYTSYGDPYQSVKSTPGSGGTVKTFQPLFRTPPPPLNKNKWWQKLDKDLGVTIDATLAPSSSYPDKLSTVVAGGDLPDLTVVSSVMSPGATKLVKQGAFLDLSDRLGGDGVKKYPNLAAVPTVAWQDAAIENRTFGVPMPIANAVWVFRQDWAKSLGYPDRPKNADDVTEVLTAFTKQGPPGSKKGEKTYAFAAFDPGMDYCQQMFHVPNNWRLTKNGEFVHAIETDEYEQALNYATKLWKLGAWHPDSPSWEGGEQQEDLWLSSRAGTYYLNVTNMYGLFYMDGSESFLPPAHDGGDPTLWRGSSVFAFTALPSTLTDDKRIDELLRILDWWAAPFGSTEYLFLAYGLEGRQFEFKHGQPIANDNDQLQTERNLYWMVHQFEYTLYFPGHPDRAKAAQSQLEEIYTHEMTDPSSGLYSDAQVSKAASLDQLISDYEVGIVTGRRKLSELSQLRSRWAAAGGTQVKKELAESYKNANG